MNGCKNQLVRELKFLSFGFCFCLEACLGSLFSQQLIPEFNLRRPFLFSLLAIFTMTTILTLSQNLPRHSHKWVALEAFHLVFLALFSKCHFIIDFRLQCVHMNDFGMKFFAHIFSCECDFHATKIRFFLHLIFLLCICPVYAMCKINLCGFDLECRKP